MPLINNKLSLIVSARYSPIGWEYNMLRPLMSDELDIPDDMRASVYDVYTKLKYNISNKNNISVSVFNSHDKYRYSKAAKSDDLLRWDNLIINGEWNYNPAARWSIKTNVAYNDYMSTQQQQKIPRTGIINLTTLEVNSKIKEFTLESMAAYRLNDKWNFQFGFNVKSAVFDPGSFKQFNENASRGAGSVFNSSLYDNVQPSLFGTEVDNKTNVLLGGLHVQAEYGVKDKFLLRLAARGNYFKNDGYSKFDPELRFFGTYFITPAFGVEATMDMLSQYYHTLEGIPTGWSLDMIIPSDEINVPETTTQYYFGAFANAWKLRFSLGGFYKQMKNLVYFTEATAFFSSSLSEWKENIDIGSGKSYGVEFLTEKTGEKISFKIAYTLSRTDRVFPEINNGNAIPFKFDRRHILNANATCVIRKNKRIEQGVTTMFTLTSGHYESLRSSIYEGFMPGMDHWAFLFSNPAESVGDYNIKGLWESIFAGDYEYVDEYITGRDYYSHPNNYRMPLYIRWDVGYYINIAGAKVNHSLNVGVYNLTNRHNAYSLYWDSDNRTWKKMSLFPIMPNICYKISF